jgi:uncharacterized membrane protein YfcA
VAIELDVVTSALLVIGGVFAGYVNAVAGGGSALTLPLLMLFGIDASVANGTNRVAVGIQALTASSAFHVQGVRPWRESLLVLPWVLVGAVLGGFVAIQLTPKSLEVFFGLIFLALAVLIARGSNWLQPNLDGARAGRFRAPISYFLIGLYGGIFQAGVGIPLLLSLIYFGGMDVIRSNAAKALIITVYTGIVLVIFGSAGQVAWLHGLLVGFGGILGSVIGTRAVIQKGATLVRVVVVVILLVSGLRGLWELWM